MYHISCSSKAFALISPILRRSQVKAASCGPVRSVWKNVVHKRAATKILLAGYLKVASSKHTLQIVVPSLDVKWCSCAELSANKEHCIGHSFLLRVACLGWFEWKRHGIKHVPILAYIHFDIVPTAPI